MYSVYLQLSTCWKQKLPEFMTPVVVLFLQRRRALPCLSHRWFQFRAVSGNLGCRQMVSSQSSHHSPRCTRLSLDNEAAQMNTVFPSLFNYRHEFRLLMPNLGLSHVCWGDPGAWEGYWRCRDVSGAGRGLCSPFSPPAHLQVSGTPPHTYKHSFLASQGSGISHMGSTADTLLSPQLPCQFRLRWGPGGSSCRGSDQWRSPWACEPSYEPASACPEAVGPCAWHGDWDLQGDAEVTRVRAGDGSMGSSRYEDPAVPSALQQLSEQFGTWQAAKSHEGDKWRSQLTSVSQRTGSGWPGAAHPGGRS